MEMGEKKFRAKQVWEWLWKNGATSFEEMTNLSKATRYYLDDHFEIRHIVEDIRQESSDGTIKFRFRLHDGYLIESVLIPVAKEKRFTVCISSQVGCAMGCAFCATGKMGQKRNLDVGEIFDQFMMVSRAAAHPLTNIVFMGMGEPLLNYDNMMVAIDILSAKEGLGMSQRRMTLSTVGLTKPIMKMADSGVRFNLAISLHAATDEKRNQIIPVNQTENLEKLMSSLAYFYEKTKNKITFEYIAFERFNDTVEDARHLMKLCRTFPVKVNIIEYNQVDGVELKGTQEKRLNLFAKYLADAGVRVTIRRSRGKDIDAACGQLANKN